MEANPSPPNPYPRLFTPGTCSPGSENRTERVSHHRVCETHELLFGIRQARETRALKRELLMSLPLFRVLV